MNQPNQFDPTFNIWWVDFKKQYTTVAIYDMGLKKMAYMVWKAAINSLQK